MKRIIIITGASSGIGQEFARQIMDFRQAQELWLVARRECREFFRDHTVKGSLLSS